MNTKTKIQTAAIASVNFQDAAGRRLDGMQSKFLHFLGCIVFGRPEALGLPADFYYSRFDRAMPDPKAGDDWKQMRMRVYTNRVRIGMIRRLMKWVLVINIAALLIVTPLYFLGGYIAAKHLTQPQAYGYTMPMPNAR